MTLRPPAEPMLAQTVESVPGPGVLGDLAFEQKFDGYRALLFTPTGPDTTLQLQTRRGSLIQDQFPDLLAAASSPGCDTEEVPLFAGPSTATG
ncbi:hypothetical protein [Streptomyces xanthophaeus]